MQKLLEGIYSFQNLFIAEKQEDFSKNDLWSYLMDDKESEENLIYLIKH